MTRTVHDTTDNITNKKHILPKKQEINGKKNS